MPSASSLPLISYMVFPFLFLPFVKILKLCPTGGLGATMAASSEHVGQTKFTRATHVLELCPWLLPIAWGPGVEGLRGRTRMPAPLGSG